MASKKLKRKLREENRENRESILNPSIFISLSFSDQSKMTLKQVDWEKYISTDEPYLPYDVTFRIFSSEDQSQVQDISAHKVLLASVSEVFHTQFFGSLANGQTVIEIRQTTFYAFKERSVFRAYSVINFNFISI